MSHKTRPLIAFVSPYGHRGAVAGARKRVESLCNAFSELGAQTVCLSPWEPNAATQHINFSLEGSVANKLLALSKLGGLLRGLDPQLVISESPIVPLPRGDWVLMHMIHDAKFLTEHARRGASLVRFLHWISARLADQVLTVSNSEKKRLIQGLGLQEDQVVVSWNGISPDWLTQLPTTGNRRRFDLLYVSNFAKHKGHIALMSALRGTGLNVAFVGADYGTLVACREVAKEWKIRAEFFSGLSEQELIALYDVCGAFVFPSFLEGFGMPYLEARARSLPVLANDLPVFRELQSYLGGTVVDISSPELTRGAIYQILSEPRIQPDLQLFTWEHIATTLLKQIETKTQ